MQVQTWHNKSHCNNTCPDWRAVSLPLGIHITLWVSQQVQNHKVSHLFLCTFSQIRMNILIKFYMYIIDCEAERKIHFVVVVHAFGCLHQMKV